MNHINKLQNAFVRVISTIVHDNLNYFINKLVYRATI